MISADAAGCDNWTVTIATVSRWRAASSVGCPRQLHHFARDRRDV